MWKQVNCYLTDADAGTTERCSRLDGRQVGVRAMNVDNDVSSARIINENRRDISNPKRPCEFPPALRTRVIGVSSNFSAAMCAVVESRENIANAADMAYIRTCDNPLPVCLGTG